jgi:hypothetical protein
MEGVLDCFHNSSLDLTAGVTHHSWSPFSTGVAGSRSCTRRERGGLILLTGEEWPEHAVHV